MVKFQQSLGYCHATENNIVVAKVKTNYEAKVTGAGLSLCPCAFYSEACSVDKLNGLGNRVTV